MNPAADTPRDPRTDPLNDEQRREMRELEAKRPAWLDGWLDYPHTNLDVKGTRQLAWYAQELSVEIDRLQAELAEARKKFSERVSLLRLPCHCKPGRCLAPAIMGRQQICLDPEKAALKSEEGR